MSDVLDRKQTDAIKSQFDKFREYLQTDEASSLRSEFFKRSMLARQLLSKEKIESISRRELASILEELFRPEDWTFSAARGFRRQVKSLLLRNGPIEKRFNKYFGVALSTEAKTKLLAFFSPDDFGIWDDSVRTGLRILGLGKTLPVCRKSISGKEYAKFNVVLKTIRDLMAEEKLPIESIVDVTLFLLFAAGLPDDNEPLVEEDDLSLPAHRDWLSFFMGLFGGFFGLAFVEIGITATINVPLLYVIASSLGFLGLFRGVLFRRFITGKKFRTVYRIERLFLWLNLWFAMPVNFAALIWFELAITIRPGSIPLWAFVLFGVADLFLAALYGWTIILDRWAEGRLCLLQFVGRGSALPEDYNWLKTGLLLAMARLRRSGVSVKPGRILLGCCFTILSGNNIDQELRKIAEWTATPTAVDGPWNYFETLTFYARQAERSGTRPPMSRVRKFWYASQQLDRSRGLIVIIGFVAILLVALVTGRLSDIFRIFETFASGG